MTRRVLEPADRPREQYVFRVMGKGVFPLDMLRLNECWPHTEQDVVAVLTPGNGKEFRTIEFKGHVPPIDTSWAQHRWTVMG